MFETIREYGGRPVLRRRSWSSPTMTLRGSNNKRQGRAGLEKADLKSGLELPFKGEVSMTNIGVLDPNSD